MKTYVTKLTLGLISVGLLSACATGQMAQTSEYDDLYFTASDRNTVEFTKLNDPNKAEYQRGSYVYEQQSFSSKNVNPEYIARYNNAGNPQNLQQKDNALTDEYYVEEYEREDLRENVGQPQTINNFYGAGPYSSFGNPAFNRWGGFDPFFDPFMMDPFFGPTAFARPGWGAGFNVGIGFGLGRPGWGWNRPGWGFGNSWAFSPWRDPFYSPWGFRNAYAMGVYDGFYGGGMWNRPGIVVINNNENLGVNRRRITNGRNVQRVTRASVADRNVTSARGRSVGERSATSTRGNADGITNARTRSTRDFTRTQNEYYNRSRSTARSAESSRVYRSTTPASSSNRTYSSSEAARSSRGSSYTRSGSTSPSRSSYGSSSRSGSYGNSGSYSRGSSQSRSSGSYSRGSYGGSRSSGSYSRGSSSGSSRGGSRGSRGGGGQ